VDLSLLDAEFEQMRASVPSAAIQELLDQGSRAQEAIWLASCEALVKEVGPDDPIYNDQTFSLFYQMPSGRLEPLKIELPQTQSPDSEASRESKP